MGLSMQTHSKMRVKIGDDIYLYTDHSVGILIDAPKNVLIQREYLLDSEGDTNDRTGAKYTTKKNETAYAKASQGRGTNKPR